MVTAIIGMLMALLFTAYGSVVRTARTAARIVSEDTMRTAALTGTPFSAPGPTIGKAPVKVEYVPDQYLVVFNDTVANPRTEAAMIAAAHTGGKVLHVYDTPGIKACNLFIPEITAAALRGRANISAVDQESYFYKKSDVIPTGVARIHHLNAGRRLNPVNPATLGLPNVYGSLLRSPLPGVVAVIDGGVDPDHDDLNVARTIPFAGNFVIDSHGTHVAGTIGAKGNRQGVIGAYPGVEIWSLDVFGDDPNQSNAAFFGRLAAALQFVRNNSRQIKACNMSVGTLAPPATVTLINGLVDQCTNAGVLMVTAAGNRQLNLDIPVFIGGVPHFDAPATAPTVVCVSALADSDGRFGGVGPATADGPDDSFAFFSDYGNTVEVIAPGVDIISTLPGNQYGLNTGSSMSSPLVCGLLANYYNSIITGAGNNPGFQIQFGGRRRATAREICSLFCRVRGAELIPGLFDFRDYPLLIFPSKVR
jgi:hypothetical protein